MILFINYPVVRSLFGHTASMNHSQSLKTNTFIITASMNMSPKFSVSQCGLEQLLHTRRPYRQSDFRHSIRGIRKAALRVFAFLCFIDKALHQDHQLVLCELLAAETLLQLRAALVQRPGADEAGDVHHTA